MTKTKQCSAEFRIAEPLLSADPRQNDVFNFLSYAALTLPLALVVVAFVLERL